MSAITSNTLNVLPPQGTLPGVSWCMRTSYGLFRIYCAFSRFTAWPIALNPEVFLLRRYLENEETRTGHTHNSKLANVYLKHLRTVLDTSFQNTFKPKKNVDLLSF